MKQSLPPPAAAASAALDSFFACGDDLAAGVAVVDDGVALDDGVCEGVGFVCVAVTVVVEAPVVSGA